MTPEEQAKALAEWLEQPPGSPPPEGIDEDVLEAIYVFRPERAPAAKVSIENILELIESGPFASEKTTPESSNKTGIVVLSDARRKHRRLWSGAGAIAAAAAVLIIALPQQDDAAKIGPQMVPSPVEEQAILDTPPTAVEVQTEKTSFKTKEIDSEPPPPIAALDSQQNNLDKAPNTDPLDAALEVNQEAAISDLVGILGSVEEDAPEALGNAYTGTGSGGGGMASQSRSGGISRGSASNADDFAQGAAEPTMEEYDEVAMPAPAPESPSKRNRVFQRSEGKQQAEAVSPKTEIDFENIDMAEDEPQAVALEQNQAQSTTTLEALALPSDYLPPPEGIENQVPTQWEIAETARGLMIENKLNEALSMATTGLTLSSKNTPELSMLHYVIGRTSRQLNQDSTARDAYEKAIALNALR
jgi:hypothetical protein